MSWPTGQILLYLSIGRARFHKSFNTHFIRLSVSRSLCVHATHFFFTSSIYRRLFLLLSLFCDSLRFYCVFVVFIAVFLACRLSHSIVVFLLLLLRCVCVNVCVSKLLKWRWYRQHHTTNFRFRTCTATQHTNIGSLRFCFPFVAVVSSFIAFIHTQWNSNQYYCYYVLLMFVNTYELHSICIRFLFSSFCFYSNYFCAPMNNATTWCADFIPATIFHYLIFLFRLFSYLPASNQLICYYNLL